KSNQVIARHVKWITKPGKSVLATIGVIALVALECLVLALSIVGIYFIARGVAEYIKLEKVKGFNKKTKEPPPDLKELRLIDKQVTFNHTNYYVIHKGIIWTKSIHKPDDEWKAVYYEGKNPVELQADGANLIVIDKDKTVYYKKVIKEWRDVKNEDLYCYADKSTKNNWKSKWFSLPVFNLIANIFTGKLLKIPEGVRAWAGSHRSVYNKYQTDACGQEHVETVGTTHLYALDHDGKSISIYDPWIHKTAKLKIPVPSFTDAEFEATNISASASTLMVIGYKKTKESDGKIKKELQVYTRFVDVDILGWNPGVKYDYPGCNLSPSTRVIPMPDYQLHNLEVPKGGTVTSNIRVIQNGQGNQSRMLLVEGTNSKNETGYYWKNLDDSNWKFVENSHDVRGKIPLFNTVDGEVTPEVKDYAGKINDLGVRLKEYGDKKYLFKLELEKAGKKVHLVFNKRKTLWTLMGASTHKYEIALPPDVPKEMRGCLKSFFGNQRVIDAGFVKTTNGHLKICAKKLSIELSPVGESVG
ncbi:MAG: hypothetical protein AAGG81_09190, partial [Chlamydiota bacterium]